MSHKKIGNDVLKAVPAEILMEKEIDAGGEFPFSTESEWRNKCKRCGTERFR